ncbi:MAG: hypothetical protein U1F43_18275 [Myxococcota bacterium]
MKKMTSVQWLRLAVALVLVGIVTELLTLLDLTPPIFLAFVMIGVPCMALGMLIYIVHVLRTLRKKDAL